MRELPHYSHASNTRTACHREECHTQPIETTRNKKCLDLDLESSKHATARGMRSDGAGVGAGTSARRNPARSRNYGRWI
jgi:hypothetical protein